MTNGFQATPDDLSAASATCIHAAQTVGDQLAGLKSYVVGVEASWQGIAATTFQDLMQQYDILSNTLVSALNDIGRGLEGNRVNYTDSEQSNISSFQQIQGQLSGTNFT